MEILLIDWSPAIAAVLSLIIFLITCARNSLNVVDHAVSFIAYVVLYGLLGLVIAVIIVFALTAIYKSPQGPLVLIDYGPIGLAIGEVVGALMWRARKARIRTDG